jgi:hypothetical protein
MLAFEFPADVWGTVSDWVMITVTAVTAYFLWNTLKSQKEVQATQNRLLKIEQLRVKEAFKPNLKYSRVDIAVKIPDPNKSIVNIAIKNVDESPALNLKPIYEDDPEVIPIMFKPILKTLKNGEGYATLYFGVNSKQGEHLNCEIRFKVEYEDVAGTQYTQGVFFDAFSGGEEFRTYDPWIIKEIDG